MAFSFELSEELKQEFAILARRDKKIMEIINKKVKEIISCNEETIEHYKNLKHELKEFKRVHIRKSFVLMFKVFKQEKLILFYRFRHHDDVYKK